MWSVDGGNFRVAEKLLEASEAQLVRDRVVKVSTANNGKLIVRRQGTSLDGDRSELSRVSICSCFIFCLIMLSLLLTLSFAGI